MYIILTAQNIHHAIRLLCARGFRFLANLSAREYKANCRYACILILFILGNCLTNFHFQDHFVTPDRLLAVDETDYFGKT
jgi:hypothetical protein